MKGWKKISKVNGNQKKATEVSNKSGIKTELEEIKKAK
jgi:hypothetical protein